MLGQVFAFFQELWTNFLNSEPLEQVLAVTSLLGISVTGFVLGGRGNRQKLRDAEQRIGELQKEAAALEKQTAAQIAAAEQDRNALDPAHWLAMAEQERVEGNEERAINTLDQGYQRVRGGLSQVLEQLAAHHASLIVGPDWEVNLADARRLAHSSHLLDPSNSGGKALLDELSVMDESVLEDLEVIGSAFLPTDPEQARRLINELLRLQEKHFTAGHYRSCVLLMRRADILCRRHLAKDDTLGLLISFHLARALLLSGDAATALNAISTLLPLQEKVSGPEHPHTNRTRHLEALILFHLGQHAQALAKADTVLAWQIQKLGDDHPHTQETAALVEDIRNAMRGGGDDAMEPA